MGGTTIRLTTRYTTHHLLCTFLFEHTLPLLLYYFFFLPLAPRHHLLNSPILQHQRNKKTHPHPERGGGPVHQHPAEGDRALHETDPDNDNGTREGR
jgi:hypothetical protein